VVKNGIRMTGMPAFGTTHDDDAIRAIVALVRKLPELTNGRYAEMVKTAGLDAPEEEEEEDGQMPEDAEAPGGHHHHADDDRDHDDGQHAPNE